MSDFRLRQPTMRLPTSPTPSLGVGQLKFDDHLLPEIRVLSKFGPSPKLRNLFLRPDWRRLDRHWLDNLLTRPPAHSELTSFPRGAGPSTVQPGEVSDLLDAIWSTPVIQSKANLILDEAARRLKRDWDRLRTGEQVALVIQSGIILGTSLTAIAVRSRPGSDKFPLNLILDQLIPVPLVDGLQLGIVARGAQVAYENIGDTGIGAHARANASNLNHFEGEFEISLDLTRWIPHLR